MADGFSEDECYAAGDPGLSSEEEEGDGSSTVAPLPDTPLPAKAKPGAGAPPAPPPPKPGSKDSKEEKKRCRTCRKWFPVSEFPLSSPDCFTDKRVIDVLAKQAVQQNVGKWFAEVRQDPDRLRAVVEKYHLKCPPSDKKGAKRGKFAFVQYQEEFETNSEVLNQGAGKLMWLDEFLDYAKKPKGGPGPNKYVCSLISCNLVCCHC